MRLIRWSITFRRRPGGRSPSRIMVERDHLGFMVILSMIPGNAMLAGHPQGDTTEATEVVQLELCMEKGASTDVETG